jgi:uncharacterized Ntn-hydrolase superfamily protein
MTPLHLSRPSTFSIVAFDAETGDLGIAVQSKFLAVGAVVPWAQVGAGAIATQSYANTSYGPQGLKLLAQGHSAQETLEILTKGDPDQALRQVGIVSARGDAATFTGSDCHPWAGGVVGQGYCCQGNILVGEKTVEAMASTYENSPDPLPERLLAALAAGQVAGGDRRGQQSAALFVVRDRGGYGGFNDIWLDLRVDDHPAPIDELKRLYDLHQLYFQPSAEADLVTVTPELTREIQTYLARLGYYKVDINAQFTAETRQALWDFCGTENLEERWQQGELIDPLVLDFLRRQSS